MRKNYKYFLIIFLITIIIFIAVNTSVRATSYTSIIDKDYNTNEIKCSITIDCEGLDDNLLINTYTFQGFNYINDDYQIFSDYFYKYSLMNSSYTPIDSYNGETATISVYLPDLIVGNKYDVYFFDGNYPNVTIDESLNGIVAEVVSDDNTNYIRFQTTSIKPFALNIQKSNAFIEKIGEITTNGVYTLEAANPAGYEEYFDIWAYTDVINEFNAGEYQIEPIGDKPYLLISFADIPGEEHIVPYRYKYDTINPKIKTVIDEISESLIDPDSLYPYKSFVIEDLNYINYLNNVLDNSVDVIYYSSELKDTLKGTNFVPYFSYRMGSDGEFFLEAGGMVTVMYDGVLYPLSINMGYNLRQIIYVPTDTPNTDEALMAAAKERIANYIGKDASEINMRTLGPRTTYGSASRWERAYDMTNISDNCYELRINGQTVPITIARNSEKAKELEFKSKDLLTDVEVLSDSGRVPFDTNLNVKEIVKDSDLFNQIIEQLEIEDGLIFDLKLFSSSINDYISELENGEFLVRIPLTNEYKGKDLVAYYLNENEDDEIEEFPITISDDGKYATFKTNHFSTYTVAEKLGSSSENPGSSNDGDNNSNDIENLDNATPNIQENNEVKNSPITGDNIIIIAIICIVSLIGLIFTLILNNRKKEE